MYIRIYIPNRLAPLCLEDFPRLFCGLFQPISWTFPAYFVYFPRLFRGLFPAYFADFSPLILRTFPCLFCHYRYSKRMVAGKIFDRYHGAEYNSKQVKLYYVLLILCVIFKVMYIYNCIKLKSIYIVKWISKPNGLERTISYSYQYLIFCSTLRRKFSFRELTIKKILEIN